MAATVFDCPWVGESDVRTVRTNEDIPSPTGAFGACNYMLYEAYPPGQRGNQEAPYLLTWLHSQSEMCMISTTDVAVVAKKLNRRLICIAPRSPGKIDGVDFFWGLSFNKAQNKNGLGFVNGKIAFEVCDALCNVIKQVAAEAHAERVMIAGYSMGGFGAFQLGAYKPGLFDVVVSIAGHGIGTLEPADKSYCAPQPASSVVFASFLETHAPGLATVPLVLAIHAEQDTVSSYADVKVIIDKVRTCGGKAELITVPDVFADSDTKSKSKSGHSYYFYSLIRDSSDQAFYAPVKAAFVGKRCLNRQTAPQSGGVAAFTPMQGQDDDDEEEEEARKKLDLDFIPMPAFAGPRQGYVFQLRGVQGNGYYKEGTVEEKTIVAPRFSKWDVSVPAPGGVLALQDGAADGQAASGGASSSSSSSDSDPEVKKRKMKQKELLKKAKLKEEAAKAKEVFEAEMAVVREATEARLEEERKTAKKDKKEQKRLLEEKKREEMRQRKLEKLEEEEERRQARREKRLKLNTVELGDEEEDGPEETRERRPRAILLETQQEGQAELKRQQMRERRQKLFELEEQQEEAKRQQMRERRQKLFELEDQQEEAKRQQMRERREKKLLALD